MSGMFSAERNCSGWQREMKTCCGDSALQHSILLFSFRFLDCTIGVSVLFCPFPLLASLLLSVG